jgi:hypothetical protein
MKFQILLGCQRQHRVPFCLRFFKFFMGYFLKTSFFGIFSKKKGIILIIENNKLTYLIIYYMSYGNVHMATIS